MSWAESVSTSPEQESARAAQAVRDDAFKGIAGAALLVAGTVHLLVTPHHLIEAPVIGVLFLMLGLGQVALAMALRVLTDVRTLVAVVVLHVVVIALYVASRTVELPFMPPHDAGHQFSHLPVAGGVGNGIPVYPGARIEAVGPLDLTCLAAELLVIGGLTAPLSERLRSTVTTAIAVLALFAVVARVVTSAR